MNKKFLPLIILFFLVSCEEIDKLKNDLLPKDIKEQNKAETSNSDDGYEIRYNYKPGVERKYKNEIQIHFGSIKIKGLPDKTYKSLLELNRNQKFKEIFLILSQKSNVKIDHVDTRGVADFKVKTLEVILEELMINGQLSGMGTPMIVPIIEENELRYRVSDLGNTYKVHKMEGANKHLDLNKTLYKNLLSVLDKMQPLTDKRINTGESWDQAINESIDISSVFPPSYKAKALYTIKLDVDHTLNKVEKSDFYIGQQFDGKVQLDLDSEYGKGLMTLKFKGKGEKIIDNRIGLDQKDSQESQFELKFNFDSQKKYRPLLGNPDIVIKGTLVKNHSMLSEEKK